MCFAVAAATTAAMCDYPGGSRNRPTAPRARTRPPRSHSASPKVAARCKVAPADEYFGKLKMSILGIRNMIKDQGLKIDVDPNRAP